MPPILPKDLVPAEGDLMSLGNVPVGSKIYIWLNSSGYMAWGPSGEVALPMPSGGVRWGTDIRGKILATVIRPNIFGWTKEEFTPADTLANSGQAPYVKEFAGSQQIIVQVLLNKGSISMDTNALVTTTVNTVTKETIDAAWRTAASSSLSVVRAPMLKAMKEHGLSDAATTAMLGFLETKVGEAVFAIVLGSLLAGVPANNPKVTRLASELRILGLTNFTDQFAAVFASVLTGLAGQLPEA